jgi:dCMP deaminase
VIVDPLGRVVSMGYNGFPRGVDDSPERLNDRDLKYPIIIHAERNALLFAQRDLHGCRLYSWPVMPCISCASMIIQVGITEVVSPVSDNPRWGHWPLVLQLFQEAGVQFRQLQLLP